MAVRGMYGLPQAGLLANELLEERLNKAGYHQSKLVPGLWTHEWRPIQFTLVVDDFGVKYVGREHAEHLQRTIAEHYKVTTDWTGERYIGIKLDWDTQNAECISPCPAMSHELSNSLDIPNQQSPSTRHIQPKS